MTNVFSDQEEVVAESCCSVTDTREGWPRPWWLFISTVIEEVIK